MKRTIFSIIFLITLCAGVARAQVRGEIIGPGLQKYPIAISPLKITGASGDPNRISTGIADSIVYDLDLSGWFRILDRAAYIEDPQKSGDTLGTFDIKDWSTIGALGLVKGRFAIQGAHWQALCR
jgi:TolB protein